LPNFDIKKLENYKYKKNKNKKPCFGGGDAGRR
jgi:hypothetical protein